MDQRPEPYRSRSVISASLPFVCRQVRIMYDVSPILLHGFLTMSANRKVRHLKDFHLLKIYDCGPACRRSGNPTKTAAGQVNGNICSHWEANLPEFPTRK